MAFLTAKRISPAKADLTQPKLIYLEDAQIVMSKVYNGTKGGGATVQYGTGGRPFSKKIKVYETPSQIEVAKNPASTNIQAQDKTLGVTPAGTVQGGTAVTKYFTEVTTIGAGATDAVTLDAATVNKVRVLLDNDVSGDPLKIFPAVGEKIINKAGVDLGVNAALTIAAGQRTHLACDVVGVWREAIPGQ